MPKTTGHRDREKYLVARLAKKIPSISNFGRGTVRLGIGDDSAVLRPSAKSEFVVSCDFSLEGVHFRDATHPAVSIGYRCLARATSDIAAMGARPRYFLLALALPAEKTLPATLERLPASSAGLPAKRSNWLDSFASGMGRAARELGLLLIGGDITISPSVTICVTVIGELPAGQAISRSGARPGELIYVTGTLGAAQLGLDLLLHSSTGKPAAPKLLLAHLYPQIPIAFAHALVRRRILSAMMDISDGLSTDLARLCESSHAGARVFADKLPLVDIPSAISNYYCHPERSEGFAFTQRDVSIARHTTTHCHPERSEGSAFRFSDPLQLALHGGEDYALLFTVPPKRAPLLRAIAAKTKTRITQIGEITRSRKILLIDSSGRASSLESRGWDPFHTDKA
jgi:thiamine-monophosphate kinase